MKPKSHSRSGAFTILESFLVLGILFVLTMVLVGLYFHHQEGPAPSGIENPEPPGYRLQSSHRDSR